MKTKFIKKIFIIISVKCSALLYAKIESPRVIWHEKPSQKAIISWTNSNKTLNDKIFLSLSRDEIQKKIPQNEFHYVKHTKTQIESHILHHVYFDNLLPNKNYYLKIKNREESSKIFYFKTAPEKKGDFKLLFGGDSRTDRKKRVLINLQTRLLFEKNPRILAFVHGGDYINQGHLFTLWKEWFSDYEKTITKEGRLLPIIPTRGNHEYDTNLYNKIFASPGKGKGYYHIKILDLSIIILNTVISVAGEQKEWLKQTLQKQSLSSKWLVANYHRPAWPAVKQAGSALSQWVPYFEMFQLDLVFESDGHVLKKTVPIKNNKRNDLQGIVYVGEGGLGVPQRKPKKRWYLESPGYAVSKDHIQMLSIYDEHLLYEVVFIDGYIYDSMKIYKRSHNPFNNKILEIKEEQEGYIFNSSSNTCLKYFEKNKKLMAVHDICKSKGISKTIKIKVINNLYKFYFYDKNNKKKCLEISNKDLFLDHLRTEFKECSDNKKEQFFIVTKQNKNFFQIKDTSKKRCLHFSHILKDSSKHLVYAKKCEKISNVNRFEFIKK